jgi:hypothetical protein
MPPFVCAGEIGDLSVDVVTAGRRGVLGDHQAISRFVVAEHTVAVDRLNRCQRSQTFKIGNLGSLLLVGCTLAGTTDIRDHAILVVLARLGLRGAEVAAPSLDDVDW